MADLGSIGLPPVTRVLLIATAVVTLGCIAYSPLFGYVFHSWTLVLRHYQIWRPITNFFYAGMGIQLLFDFFCLYQTSASLEKAFMGDSAAYTWSLIVIACMLHVLNAVFIQSAYLFHGMLRALVYLWTKQDPSMSVSIFGLFSVPARLYPVVLLGMDFINGGPPGVLNGLMGILVGHLWWFLSSYLPARAPVHLRRSNPFAMPASFRRLFVHRQPQTSSFAPSSGRTTALGSGISATNYRAPDAAAQVRHRWGSGQRLGGEAL